MINDDQMLFNLPGRIVEFFPEDQTATVKICVEKTFSNADVETATMTRGLLHDVPVHTAQGGGWAITFPIAPGDTCDLFFSQIGYDYWLFNDKDSSGTLAGLPKPHLKRSFSEEDGYALVGFNPLPRAIQDFSAASSQWRNVDKEQMISLEDDLSIIIKSGTTTIVLTKDGDITMNTSTAMTVTAPSSTFNGSMHVTGAITTDSTINATGIIESDAVMKATAFTVVP